jgi:hypothetical protein
MNLKHDLCHDYFVNLISFLIALDHPHLVAFI